MEISYQLDDAQGSALSRYLKAGGVLWVVPPLGEWDSKGERRPRSMLEELRGIDSEGWWMNETPQFREKRRDRWQTAK